MTTTTTTHPALALTGWALAASFAAFLTGAILIIDAESKAGLAAPNVMVCFDRAGAPLSALAAWSEVKECRTMAIREVR